jgi:hypothetical protein
LLDVDASTGLTDGAGVVSLQPPPLPPLCVRFEVFTAVTIKNVVFWDIKTQFVLHSRRKATGRDHPKS